MLEEDMGNKTYSVTVKYHNEPNAKIEARSAKDRKDLEYQLNMDDEVEWYDFDEKQFNEFLEEDSRFKHIKVNYPTDIKKVLDISKGKDLLIYTPAGLGTYHKILKWIKENGKTVRVYESGDKSSDKDILDILLLDSVELKGDTLKIYQDYKNAGKQIIYLPYTKPVDLNLRNKFRTIFLYGASPENGFEKIEEQFNESLIKEYYDEETGTDEVDYIYYINDAMFEYPTEDADEALKFVLDEIRKNYLAKGDAIYRIELYINEKDPIENYSNDEVAIFLRNNGFSDEEIDKLVYRKYRDAEEILDWLDKNMEISDSLYNKLLRKSAKELIAMIKSQTNLYNKFITEFNNDELNESLDETAEKWNMGSDKSGLTAEEMDLLDRLAQKLEVNSPNGYKYVVQSTYEDFGANMQWYTIVCYNKKGHSWQVLNTKEWLDLMNTGDVDAVYSEVINGDYFQDKTAKSVFTSLDNLDD